MNSSKPTPRIAVLMSTYNGERFIREQLDSIRAQEGVEVQLFVRDDGSSDATFDILREYADIWPQLANVQASPNLKPARSFLALLKSAPGDFDYYAFADQDDYWAPDKLITAVSALRANDADGVGLYCSHVRCTDEALRPLGDLPLNDDPRFEHILFENIAYGCTTVLSNALWRLVSERAPDHGPAMHDWWCALVASAFGKVVFDPTPRILYRQHGSNDLGVQPNLLAEWKRQYKVIMRNPRGYYPIHAQAAAFQSLYGADLTPKKRRLVDSLVRSKRSPGARLRYALWGRVERRHLTSNLLARGLILMGWY